MYKKHSKKIHIHLLAKFWAQNFLPEIRSGLYVNHKNIGFVHKRISDPTPVGFTILLWEVQNGRKKNPYFLSLGENYLLPSFLSLVPTQTRNDPL